MGSMGSVRVERRWRASNLRSPERLCETGWTTLGVLGGAGRGGKLEETLEDCGKVSAVQGALDVF